MEVTGQYDLKTVTYTPHLQSTDIILVIWSIYLVIIVGVIMWLI